MFEALLDFFSDLILFSAGLVVVVFWIVIIMVVAIETWDAIFEKDQPKEEEES